jgi:hypothetical protein
MIKPGIKPGSLMMPLALRCSALDCCATRESNVVYMWFGIKSYEGQDSFGKAQGRLVWGQFPPPLLTLFLQSCWPQAVSHYSQPSRSHRLWARPVGWCPQSGIPADGHRGAPPWTSIGAEEGKRFDLIWFVRFDKDNECVFNQGP